MYLKLLFFLIFPITLNSQYKSIENLTEAEASDYLKLEGFKYNITRSEDESGLIKWSGSNSNSSNGYTKVIMSYYFWPFNLGIQSKMKTTIYKLKPNINDWINKLPYNLKVLDKSSTFIYASDNSDINKATVSKSIKRADEPYYIGASGNFYFWYENESSLFRPQIEVEEIGFKYGNTEQNFFTFLGEDTYDLTTMVRTFMLDYSSFILKKSNEAYKKLEENKLKIYQNSMIDFSNITVSAQFSNLEEGTIAIALGMDNDDEINLIVNPDNWKTYSEAKRFYIIYHELGHDIFNLNHGNGGKMMYNYADKEVTWKDFIDDRIKMFEAKIAQNIPKNITDSQKRGNENDNIINVVDIMINDIPKLFENKEYAKIINASQFIKNALLNNSIGINQKDLINSFYYFAIANINSGSISVGCEELNYFLNNNSSDDKLLEAKANYFKQKYCNE